MGDQTIVAMVYVGCAPLLVAIEALLEQGFRAGDIISAKQIKACGIGAGLAKKAINQCEGREWNKTKTKKKAKKVKALPQEEYEYLIDTIRTLLKENPMNKKAILMVQGMSYDELPEDLRPLKFEDTPPEHKAEPAAAKDLFFRFTYENGEQPLALREPGRPARIVKIPNLDRLAQAFGVNRPNDQQHHHKIWGKKTVMDFCDAYYVETLKKMKPVIGKNQQSMSRLCRILGDSDTTVRARHKRNGIKGEANYSVSDVTWREVQALLLRCRKGCKWELVLPVKELVGISYKEGIWEPIRHQLSKEGLAFARRDWERAGSPGNFYDFLKIYVQEANSYEFTTS